MLSLRPLIHLFLHPISIGALLLLIALICTKYSWLITGKILWVTGGLWFFLIIFTPLPQKLVMELESRHPTLLKNNFNLNPNFDLNFNPNHATSTQIHILVLASGFTNDTTLSAANRLSGTMLRRVAKGVRLYHHLQKIEIKKKGKGKGTGTGMEKGTENQQRFDVKLILSGPAVDKPVSQASMAAKAAVGLGVNPDDTRLLEHPLNTWQEAQLYAQYYGKRNGSGREKENAHADANDEDNDNHNNNNHRHKKDASQLILVTSAIHMLRAHYLFREKGFDPIPAPTAHLVKREQYRTSNQALSFSFSYWKPGLGGIKLMKHYLHEVIGIWYARLVQV